MAIETETDIHRHRCGHVCDCRLVSEAQCLHCDIRDFEQEAEDFKATVETLARSSRSTAIGAARRVMREIEGALAGEQG